MKLAYVFEIVGITAVLFGAGCAGQNTSQTTARSSDAKIYEEQPFVEGAPTPLPPSGFTWCLEKRAAVFKQATEQAIIRPATSYYETVPAQYTTRTERILVEPEQRKTVMVSPATYRDTPEQRLVEPANVEYRTIPAQYSWVTEEVEVVPERTEKIFIPAQYEEYSERMMTAPARTVRADVQGCDKDGSNVDCYASRTIPAEYATVRKKRLAVPATTQLRTIPSQKKLVRTRKVVSPARVEKVDIPAQYQTVVKKVLDRPAQYREEVIPARYQPIEKKVLAVPESQKLVNVPAKYGTECRTVLVAPERLVWVLKKRPENACPLPIVMAQE